MSEKIIELLFASSEKLSVGSMEFADFLNHLNNTYHQKGISIELLNFEPFDGSIQVEYNENDYIENVSTENFENKFILQIKIRDINTELKNYLSNISVDENKVIFLNEIPRFTNNKDNIKLKNKIQELEDDVYNAFSSFQKSREDTNCSTEIINSEYEKDKLKKEYSTLENSLIKFAGDIVELTSKPMVSVRLEKAKEHFAKGEIKEAAEVLDFYDISNDIEISSQFINNKVQLIEIINNSINEDRRLLTFYVKELNLKAKSLLLDTSDKNRFNQAEECYEKAVYIEEKYKLDRSSLLLFADYLKDQCRIDDSIKLYNEYLSWVKQDFVENYNENLPLLLQCQTNLGELYLKISQYKKSEEMCLASLKIINNLIKTNHKNYLFDLLTLQKILGDLYRATGRYKLAELMYISVLNTRKKMKCIQDDNYFSDLSLMQNALGLLYIKTKRYNEAEKMFLDSLCILNKLESDNFGKYLTSLAIVKNNLGELYLITKRYQEGEEIFLSALDIQYQFAYKSTEETLEILSMVQKNLGIIYKNIQRYNDAEEMFQDTLNILNKLSEKEPEKHLAMLLDCKDNIGYIYMETKQYEKAEKSYLSVLKIREQLANENPVIQNLYDLAISKANMGVLFENTNRYENAEEMYIAVLKIIFYVINNFFVNPSI